MDLKRLPPSLLVALGLAGCGPAVDDGSTAGESGDSRSSTGDSGDTVGPCLSPVIPTGSATGASSVGPCLGMVTTGPILDVGATVGPCLEPPFTTSSGTGPDTDTDTDTDSDTSGGDGTDSGTTGGADTGVGPCLVPPSAPSDPVGERGLGFAAPAPQPRSLILDRLRQAGILPDDVAARLTLRADDDS